MNFCRAALAGTEQHQGEVSVVVEYRLVSSASVDQLHTDSFNERGRITSGEPFLIFPELSLMICIDCRYSILKLRSREGIFALLARCCTASSARSSNAYPTCLEHYLRNQDVMFSASSPCLLRDTRARGIPDAHINNVTPALHALTANPDSRTDSCKASFLPRLGAPSHVGRPCIRGTAVLLEQVYSRCILTQAFTQLMICRAPSLPSTPGS